MTHDEIREDFELPRCTLDLMPIDSPPTSVFRGRTPIPLRRLILLATVPGLVLLATAACGDDPDAPPTPTPTATATSPAATETPDPTTTPSPDERGEPGEVDEDDDGDLAGRVLDELQDRSFRQFEPHRDGDPRKAVILDFFGPGIAVWGQFAEGGHAVDEWEITAGEYRIEWNADNSEATIHLENARYTQTFPEPCTDCVDVSGLSISIRNVFDPAHIEFRLNDPDRALPRPFPVFGDWTRFNEDEIFD